MNEDCPAEVAIILPTYNRAEFIPKAFESIRSQSATDWELIVVDDGSTDDTRNTVKDLSSGIDQTVRYVHQENRGPYAARNTGLDRASAKYIAFFDSDDEWLPHHLENCVAALADNPDVDWVFSAARMVTYTSGQVLAENAFYHPVPMPFLDLKTSARGSLRVIEDSRAVEVAIRHGLRAGLQTSAVRRKVFADMRLPPYQVGEDQVAVIHALKRGFKMAYFDDVHVVYNIHENGVSAARNEQDSHTISAIRELVRAFESLRDEVSLSRRERAALNERVSRERFWNLGYRLQRAGRHADAIPEFWRGLMRRPSSFRFWKTFASAILQFGWRKCSLFHRNRVPA